MDEIDISGCGAASSLLKAVVKSNIGSCLPEITDKLNHVIEGKFLPKSIRWMGS
jgi:hypothetical protein